MRKPLLTWLPAMLLIAILLTACGGAATPTQQADSQAPAPTEVSAPAEAPAPTTASPTEAPVATESAMPGMMLPEVDPSAVSGNIIAAGSSTVYPLG